MKEKAKQFGFKLIGGLPYYPDSSPGIPWWETLRTSSIRTGLGTGILPVGSSMFLDTHAAVFLHGGLLGEFSQEGLKLLELEPLYFSPMAALELQYLFEIGRIRVPAKQILSDLRSEISLKVLDRQWQTVVETSWELSWTRDPFDRIIAAQALLEEQKLLTRDGILQKNLPGALW